MRYINIVYEDFVNYKKPSMFIGTISCNGKCWKDAGLPSSICQNDELRGCEIKTMDSYLLAARYVYNPITEAVVFGGLEPLDQEDEIYEFIDILRNKFNDDSDVVIYSGYYPEEVTGSIDVLKKYNNIIVKFGRYIPDDKEVVDNILGVTLSSSNQFSVRIS